MIHTPKSCSYFSNSSLQPPPPSSCYLHGCGGPTPHHLCGSTGTCSSNDCHQTEQIEGGEGAHRPNSLLQPNRRRGGEDQGKHLCWGGGGESPYWRTEGTLPGPEYGDIGQQNVCNPSWRRTQVLRPNAGYERKSGFNWECRINIAVRTSYRSCAFIGNIDPYQHIILYTWHTLYNTNFCDDPNSSKLSLCSKHYWIMHVQWPLGLTPMWCKYHSSAYWQCTYVHSKTHHMTTDVHIRHNQGMRDHVSHDSKQRERAGLYNTVINTLTQATTN